MIVPRLSLLLRIIFGNISRLTAVLFLFSFLKLDLTLVAPFYFDVSNNSKHCLRLIAAGKASVLSPLCDFFSSTAALN